MATKLTGLTAEQLKRAAELKERIEKMNNELSRILSGKTLGTGASVNRGPTSAAGKARIAAAQKRRWAAYRKEQGR